MELERLVNDLQGNPNLIAEFLVNPSATVDKYSLSTVERNAILSFFSFDNAPILIKTVSMLNPLTYQLNTLRDFAFETGAYNNFIIVIMMTSLMGILSLYSVKNAELTSDER